MGGTSTNFDFLATHDARLVPVAAQAELYFHRDPVVALIRLRLFAEILAQEAAAHAGLFTFAAEDQAALLVRLRNECILTREVADLFHALRKAGNRAVHDNQGSASDALSALKQARAIAVWFHQTFGDPKLEPGPFVPPSPPEDATAALRAQLDLLEQKLAAAVDASKVSASQPASRRWSSMRRRVSASSNAPPYSTRRRPHQGPALREIGLRLMLCR